MSYALIGCPLALWLAFGLGFGAVGIAAGHTVGKLLMTLVTLAVVRATDWHAEAERAVTRLGGGAATRRSSPTPSGAPKTATRELTKAEDRQAMLAGITSDREEDRALPGTPEASPAA